MSFKLISLNPEFAEKEVMHQNEDQANWSKMFSEARIEDIPFPSSFAEQFLSIVKSLFPEGSSFLEVGSGSGEISGYLALHGYNVTLLDKSREALALSKRFFEKYELSGQFIEGNLFDIPLETQSFDCVWNSGVMEHFSDEEIVKGLQEMKRVSRNKVIVIVPNALSVPYRISKWYLERTKTWPYGREKPKRSLKTLFKKAEILYVTEEDVQVYWGIRWFEQLGVMGSIVSRRLFKSYEKNPRKWEKNKFSKKFLGYLLITIGSKGNATRIGHIAYSYKPFAGGAEHYIKTFFQMLNGGDFKQTVYQAKTKSEDSEIKAVSLLNIPILKKRPTYLYNVLLNVKFASLWKENILIIHDPFHFWPVSWKRNSIVVSHGIRWDGVENSSRQYEKIHLLSAKYAFRYAHKLVANDSRFFREMGVKLNPKEKMFEEILPRRWFIPNCVDIELFREIKSISGLRKLNPILIPRNMVPARGVHLAIKAFSYFRKDFPDTNLILCGNFPDGKYKEEIFSLIHDLHLIGKVYFLGSVRWESMPKIYSSSLLTVIPTLSEEGTSLAALESMACGTATVSTNVGGLIDLPTIQSIPTSEMLNKAMAETFLKRKEIGKFQQAEVERVYNLENFTKAWKQVLES